MEGDTVVMHANCSTLNILLLSNANQHTATTKLLVNGSGLVYYTQYASTVNRLADTYSICEHMMQKYSTLQKPTVIPPAVNFVSVCI